MNIKEYYQQKIEEFKNLNINIKLGILDATAAGDTANAIYIKKKVEDFQQVGWDAIVIKTDDIEEGVRQAQLEQCTAVIAQLPVREGVKYNGAMIPVELDCDGVNPMSYCTPATPAGIMNYLRDYGFDFVGKKAVVVGRSEIVGRPMGKCLLDADCTVTMCHSKTKEEDLKMYLKDADLVIAAVGKPGFIKREDCPKAVVIDVGINRVNGKICGDFIENGGVSTPVPGGVGLLTRIALMDNCVRLKIKN